MSTIKTATELRTALEKAEAERDALKQIKDDAWEAAKGVRQRLEAENKLLTAERDSLQSACDARDAHIAALAAQEPFAYAVIDPDGGSLEYSAQWPEACHEHINDCITEHDIDGAGKWIVRPLFAAAGAAPVPSNWKDAVSLAYGHLWHVNNEPMAPIPLRSDGEASYAARKLLRDLLTTDERGQAINAVRELLTAAPKGAAS